MTLVQVLESLPYVHLIWVNSENEYYFFDPLKAGFESKTREEIINPI